MSLANVVNCLYDDLKNGFKKRHLLYGLPVIPVFSEFLNGVNSIFNGRSNNESELLEVIVESGIFFGISIISNYFASKNESKLKSAASELDNIFYNSPDGIIFCGIKKDESGVDNYYVRKVNPAFKSMMSVPHNIDGADISKIAPNHGREFIKQYADIAMIEGASSFEFNMSRTKKTYYVKMFKTDNSGFALIFNNITEEKNAKEILEMYNKNLEYNLDLKDLLLKEVNHRVKNNLNIIISLIGMEQSKFTRISDEYSRNILSDIEGKIHSISRVHELFYKSGNYEGVKSSEYLPNLMNDLFDAYSKYSNETINLNIDIDDNHEFGADSIVPVGLILSELLSNSFKYAFLRNVPGAIEQLNDFVPTISLSLRNISDGYELRFSDNGLGLPVDFAHNSTSLGMEVIDGLSQQIHAKYRIVSGYERHLRIVDKSPEGFVNKFGVGTEYIFNLKN